MAHDPGGSDWHFGLLDWLVDAQHRASRRASHLVCEDDAADLGVVRTWTPRRAWRLDLRWVDRFVRKLCHFSMQRAFCVLSSSQEQYTVVCEQTVCPWHVHTQRPKYKIHWIVSKVEAHSCLLSSVLPRHRNLTSTFIANVMYGEIVKKTDLEAKHIMVAIEQKFKYKISYVKAWRAKQKVLERRFGSFKASYDNLPRML